jgi:dihydrofolate reductase
MVYCQFHFVATSLGENRKVVLFIACSLDGYIAGKDDDIKWLFDDEDYGYVSFLASIDVVLMGRRTYDLVLQMGPFPYVGKECYVFSRSLMGGDDNVEFVNQPVKGFLDALRENEGKNIWLVGGSELISHFMQADIVDEFIISVHPRILGSGIPLFKPGTPSYPLRLMGLESFSSGLVQIHYRRK